MARLASTRFETAPMKKLSARMVRIWWQESQLRVLGAGQDRRRTCSAAMRLELRVPERLETKRRAFLTMRKLQANSVLPQTARLSTSARMRLRRKSVEKRAIQAMALWGGEVQRCDTPKGANKDSHATVLSGMSQPSEKSISLRQVGRVVGGHSGLELRRRREA